MPLFSHISCLAFTFLTLVFTHQIYEELNGDCWRVKPLFSHINCFAFSFHTSIVLPLVFLLSHPLFSHISCFAFSFLTFLSFHRKGKSKNIGVPLNEMQKKWKWHDLLNIESLFLLKFSRFYCRGENFNYDPCNKKGIF